MLNDDGQDRTDDARRQELSCCDLYSVRQRHKMIHTHDLHSINKRAEDEQVVRSRDMQPLSAFHAKAIQSGQSNADRRPHLFAGAPGHKK